MAIVWTGSCTTAAAAITHASGNTAIPSKTTHAHQQQHQQHRQQRTSCLQLVEGRYSADGGDQGEGLRQMGIDKERRERMKRRLSAGMTLQNAAIRRRFITSCNTRVDQALTWRASNARPSAICRTAARQCSACPCSARDCRVFTSCSGRKRTVVLTSGGKEEV